MKSSEIVDAMMQKHLTNHELTTKFGIDLDKADRIGRLSAHAFGPDGKGYAWYVKQVEKILGKKTPMKMDAKKLVASELVKVAKLLVGMEFPTQDAYDKYMNDHPAANKSLHRVKKEQKENEGHSPVSPRSNFHHQTTIHEDTIDALGWTGAEKKINPETAEGRAKVKSVLDKTWHDDSPEGLNVLVKRFSNNEFEIRDAVKKFLKEKTGDEWAREGDREWFSLSDEDRKSIKYFNDLAEKAGHAAYVVQQYAKHKNSDVKTLASSELVKVAKLLVAAPVTHRFTKMVPVKLVPEGSTRMSLQNAQAIMDAGYEFQSGITYYDQEKANYETVVMFSRGNETASWAFKGFSAGYSGEGPRGLVEFGQIFNVPIKPEIVMDREYLMSRNFLDGNGVNLGEYY